MSTSRAPIIGVFDDKAAAEHALDNLMDAGLNSDQLMYSGNVGQSNVGDKVKNWFTRDDSPTGNIASDLQQMGLPADAVNYYTNEYNSGHQLVAAYPANNEQEVIRILQANGAHHLNIRGQTDASRTAGGYAQATGPADMRGDEYKRAAGYVQPDTSDVAPRPGAPERNRDIPETDQERTIRLREEQLQAEKRRVQTGEVQIHKEVVTEQKNIEVPVSHEEVVVERRPASGAAPASETPIQEGETTRIPISEEQVNVTKTPVETGEVTVSKREVEEKKRFGDTVRREEARIEQSGDVPIFDEGERGQDLGPTNP